MRARLADLSMALVSIVLCLAAAETVVRLLGLAPEVKPIDVSGASSVFRRSSNPILGFELKASYRDPDADLIVSYPSTNAHGQRDAERSLAKPPGTRRILLLGDSVVEGTGIRKLENTLSSRLEALYAGEVEVLNFGVSGYCTRAEVELLETKGLAFDPDAVVLVFVGNDFDNFNRQLFQLGSALERPAIVKGLFLGSQLFRVLAIEFDWFAFGLDADPLRFNSEAIGDNNVVDGFARLRELADRYGFDVAVAIWPRFTDDDVEDVHFMPDGSGELVVESLAAVQGFPTLRLSEAFREHMAASERPPNPRLHYTTGDETHPSPRGTRVAAKALERSLPQLFARFREGRGLAEADPTALVAARAKSVAVPTYANVYNNTGNKLAAQGKLAPARSAYEQALSLDPNYTVAHNNLGNILQAQGEREAAIRSYRRAVELMPDYTDARYNLARALVAAGRTEEAIEHYRVVIERKPDWAPARLRLAEILIEKGRSGEAVALWSDALTLRPGWPLAREQLELATRARALDAER